ncbi:glycosyltransferase family 4 protein [Frisingicoccus sp.]|uniref:glycosyltransferase family 4 protein n=1 Tax=Frisingicoccus sp. TaxID=1918627 RepID=UPI003AB4FFBA
MKKIGFVVPWHGQTIPGGAEMALRGVTEHLNKAGVDVEILTTCVKEFMADWNENYHKPGLTVENHIPVRRFKVRKRNVDAFNRVNIKLMNDEQLTPEEEEIFCKEMINSPDMYKYMEQHKDEYHCFVGIPYMFGPVYYMCKKFPEKAVMIPCFHEEAYIYMDVFKKAFSNIRGMIFNAEPEKVLAQRVYDTKCQKLITPGLGLDTSLVYDEERFRAKFNIQEPFILYAGRKDVGKNIYTLIRYFSEYKKRCKNDLKLVLIGGGKVGIPRSLKGQVYDLGFVSIQDKYDAYGSALTLCQPSKHESFSFVIMESWLCKRPVMVHEGCDVTKHFAVASQGGFYFNNYFEFEEEVNYYLEHPEMAFVMGENGRKFVLENFDWDIVTRKYIEFFEGLYNHE